MQSVQVQGTLYGGGGGGGRDADGGNMYIVMTSVQANGPHYHHTAHITLQ